MRQALPMMLATLLLAGASVTVAQAQTATAKPDAKLTKGKPDVTYGRCL
jgi:hypothetical protein